MKDDLDKKTACFQRWYSMWTTRRSTAWSRRGSSGDQTSTASTGTASSYTLLDDPKLIDVFDLFISIPHDTFILSQLHIFSYLFSFVSKLFIHACNNSYILGQPFILIHSLSNCQSNSLNLIFRWYSFSHEFINSHIQFNDPTRLGCPTNFISENQKQLKSCLHVALSETRLIEVKIVIKNKQKRWQNVTLV